MSYRECRLEPFDGQGVIGGEQPKHAWLRRMLQILTDVSTLVRQNNGLVIGHRLVGATDPTSLKKALGGEDGDL